MSPRLGAPPSSTRCFARPARVERRALALASAPNLECADTESEALHPNDVAGAQVVAPGSHTQEETARHARLAPELRLPVFEWYTPLWAAVQAMLAGRYNDFQRLSGEAAPGRAACRGPQRRAVRRHGA